MKKLIIIEADENDGDYIISCQYLIEEHLSSIKKMAKALKKVKKEGIRHNFPIGGCIETISAFDMYVNNENQDLITIEEFEIFKYYVPNNEWGIHTIKSIKILNVKKEINLL